MEIGRCDRFGECEFAGKDRRDTDLAGFDVDVR